MNDLMPKQAKREKLTLAMGLMGASGSGKTLSALLIGYGLMTAAHPDLSEEERWAKVGLVDTEHRRSLVYAGTTKAGVYIPDSWQHVDFKAPYTSARYVTAIQNLINAGCEVVIVDSLSHNWEAEGGILDLVEKAGGRYQDWKHAKPHERMLYEALFESPVHIIACTRSKQEYALERNSETDKLEVKKLGTKPIQRDNLEYEFQVVFHLDNQHRVTVTKNNTDLFDENGFRVLPDVGVGLYHWLDQGVDVRAQERAEREETIQFIREASAEHESIAKVVSDLEHKARLNIEELNMRLLRRAKLIVEEKLEELHHVQVETEEESESAEG